MNRRYRINSIGKQIYCSSSCDYFADLGVRDERTQKIVGRRFWINGDTFLGLDHHPEWEAPKYLVQEVLEWLRGAYLAGELKVYEYNQDKEKRYENLRYHEDALLKCALVIGCGELLEVTKSNPFFDFES